MKSLALLLLLLPLSLLEACSTEPMHPRHPLQDQILSVRPGQPALSNRACEAWDKKGVCTNWVVKSYPLADATFRKTVNDLQFMCVIGHRVFKVCLDKPGFCRHTTEKHCTLRVFCKSTRHEEYIPIEPLQFHLDAGTQCFSDDRYPFEDLN